MDERWPSSFKGSFEDTKPSFFLVVGWAKMDENVLVFATHDVVHGPLDITWQFTQLELQLQILVANIHVTKSEKNMS